MIEIIRETDWRDPFDVLGTIVLVFFPLLGIAIFGLLIAAGIEDASRRAHQPHELSTSDGSTPPAIVTDEKTGCQYLRGDWDPMTPRMGADGRQVCTGAAR